MQGIVIRLCGLGVVTVVVPLVAAAAVGAERRLGVVSLSLVAAAIAATAWAALDGHRRVFGWWAPVVWAGLTVAFVAGGSLVAVALGWAEDMAAAMGFLVHAGWMPALLTIGGWAIGFAGGRPQCGRWPAGLVARADVGERTEGPRAGPVER